MERLQNFLFSIKTVTSNPTESGMWKAHTESNISNRDVTWTACLNCTFTLLRVPHNQVCIPTVTVTNWCCHLRMKCCYLNGSSIHRRNVKRTENRENKNVSNEGLGQVQHRKY